MAHWQIIPRLTVTDLFDGLLNPADLVISAAELPDFPQRSKVRIHFYFPDIDALPDMELAHRIADFAAHEVGLQREVVFHCDQGKNRSVFLAGLALYAGGWRPPTGLVAFLREQRPGALTNATFAGELERLSRLSPAMLGRVGRFGTEQ